MLETTTYGNKSLNNNSNNAFEPVLYLKNPCRTTLRRKKGGEWLQFYGVNHPNLIGGSVYRLNTIVYCNTHFPHRNWFVGNRTKIV